MFDFHGVDQRPAAMNMRPAEAGRNLLSITVPSS
jgi:hypothetical protein